MEQVRASQAPAVESVPGRSRAVSYLLALGTVVFWGASFPLTKAALNDTGPTAIAFLRWAISAIFLVGWLVWVGRRDTSQGLVALGGLLQARWRTATWVGLVGITLFYFLENLALNFTTATNAGVLSNLTSVFLVLIGTLLLRERLSTAEWLAVLAAFVGSVLVSQGAGHLALSSSGLMGDAMMVVATFFGAVYSIGGKTLSERYPAAIVTTAVSAIGAIFLFPLAVIEGLRLDLPPATWGMIILLGIGAGALANLWWLALLARMAASRAALALFLIPIISAGLSVAFLGEPLTPLLVIGSASVLAAVVMVQRPSG